MTSCTLVGIHSDESDIFLQKGLDNIQEYFAYDSLIYNISYAQFVQNKSTIGTEWCLVLFTNEQLSPALIQALPILVDDKDTDAFFFYHLINKDTAICFPRLFKTKLSLCDNQLRIKGYFRGQRILDGWVYRKNGFYLQNNQST